MSTLVRPSSSEGGPPQTREIKRYNGTLLSRQEMSFDFGGARLDPKEDRELLVWIFNQFLYGEVTGIQVGHWLYRAPTLDAAHFLARQAMEELQHVDRFHEILEILAASPGAPHPAVRFLSTGMMGDDWTEHVCMEMALGEGLVLTVLYALIDTIEDPAICGILARAARQEERHVAFGEIETVERLQVQPGARRRLLGLSLFTLSAVDVLGRAARHRASSSHPVLKQLPDFVDHVRQTAELRLQRMGILKQPLRELSRFSRARLMLGAGGGHLARRLGAYLPWPRRRLLTNTYLLDPRLAPREANPRLVKGSESH